MILNQNSGYGQAILGAIHSAVGGAVGNIHIVLNSSDTDEKSFQHMQDLFTVDADGRSRFFTSLSDAVTEAESDNNDVIILDGNSTHTLTEMLTVSKNKVHFIGLDWLLGLHRRIGQSSIVTLGVTTAATDLGTVLVTGTRCTFRGIKFTNTNTVAQGIYAFLDGGQNTYLEDCEIFKGTDFDVTGAADMVCNGDTSTYKNCYIGTTVTAISGAIIRPSVTFSRELADTGAVARDVTFENCIFARRCGNAANRFLFGTEATSIERLCYLKECVFWNAALAAAAPAQNVAFGATQTDGSMLLHNCSSIGAGTAMSTTTGVFVDSPVPTAATSGISVQAA